MDLRQLSHFVAVAEDGSFTRAARRSNIVQSGISASIAALEREIGVTLFQRTKHRAELTAAGRALLVEARRALAAVAAGRVAALAADASVSGRLRIGAARVTPKRVQLPRIIHEFQTANPEVDLIVRERASVDFDDLRNGNLDLVIGPSPGEEAGVTSIPLSSSTFMLACADTHPLAGRRSIRLSSLSGEQFIDVPTGWVTRRLADRALADAGIQRRRIIEVNSVDFALLLIAEQTGVSLLPEIAADYAVGVTFVPLAVPIGVWEYFVSFLGDEPPTPVAKAFLALLQAGPVERRGRNKIKNL
jgi:DNA-binding transcriptional LysR family regulator